MPKLNFNQESNNNKQVEKENYVIFDKKLPDEKKYKLVYLDDEYAKVETIKLKPKTNTPQSFVRRSAFENTSTSYTSLAKRPETFDIKGLKQIHSIIHLKVELKNFYF